MSETNPYDEFMLDHIRNARNYLALPDASHHAAGINPLCGDEMNVYANVVDGRISAVGFQCSCCGISMASASVMTELMKSATISDVKPLLRAFIQAVSSDDQSTAHALDPGQLELLQAVRALPSRRKCAALPWLTLEAALDGRAQAVSVD
ncbi:MAG: iscU [Betaproteobacteria bacterium]|nr:iscU [Betaproteobacteria bacterium]